MSDLVLTARDISAGYGDEDILHGVSIDVRRGTIVAVIGPNGSGKSTLLKTVYGLVPARRGRVTLFDGPDRPVELTGLKPNRITALGVNMVPQLANVFPEMSVLENLEIGALPAPERFSQQLERVLAAFPMLRAMLRKRAATLSGGQRQMLGFARAMMSDPRVLILDEPSAGLAPAILEEVFARVKAINAAGVSILMVEQKARQCLAMADYGYVLDQGQNRLEGPGQALLEDPEVVRLYLGVRSGRERPAP
ncbi:MAG TPA: ABC transporter ATP-binding protein [Methylomirabilota bacterium]|nr:ABC transporter ATP-binding protein [Methylomirabilota bacterium]